MKTRNREYFNKDQIILYVEEQLKIFDIESLKERAYNERKKENPNSTKRFTFSKKLKSAWLLKYKKELIDLETKRREVSFYEKYGREYLGNEEFEKNRANRLEFLDKHGLYEPPSSQWKVIIYHYNEI